MLKGLPNITLLPSLDYLPMVQLMKRCYLALTDSGGIQEEAPGLGKPRFVQQALRGDAITVRRWLWKTNN